MMAQVFHAVGEAIGRRDPGVICSVLSGVEESIESLDEQIRLLSEQREELAAHERRLRESLAAVAR